MLKHNRVANIYYAKIWLRSGWGIFKQSPITWSLMVLIFTIFYLVGMNSLTGKAIAALLTPVFAGGIYMAVHNSDNGKAIAIENLFSMFKDSQKLKQLLIIGAIGVAIVGLTYIAQNMVGSDYEMRYKSGNDISYSENKTTTLGATLSCIINWSWRLASLFSIPLVAIKNQMAIESLKNSLSASLINLRPLFIFYGLGVLMMILGAIPYGLGLLVVLPVFFCSSYFVFKTVYLEVNEQSSTNAPNFNSVPDPNAAVTVIPNILTNFEASIRTMVAQDVELQANEAEL